MPTNGICVTSDYQKPRPDGPKTPLPRHVGAQAAVHPVLRGEATMVLHDLRLSSVGFAVFDRNFRFVDINGALARMNGIEPEKHLGERIHDLLGEASSEVELMFERVFVTGRPVSGVQISAHLPGRSEMGYWIEDFVPLFNAQGQAKYVCVFVVEITEQRWLETLINQIYGDLPSPTTAMGCQVERQPRQSIASDSAARLGWLARLSPVALREPGSGLSPRETQIVRLVAEGNSNKEAASNLGISIKTVEAHRARIMLKLHLNSSAALIRFAIRSGIIE